MPDASGYRARYKYFHPNESTLAPARRRPDRRAV